MANSLFDQTICFETCDPAPEGSEYIEVQGYEGIELVMDYLDDIVLKMVNAGADYSKLIAKLANEYCRIRKRILDKAAEEGIEVFPTGEEIPDQDSKELNEEDLFLRVEGQTLTLYPGNTYTIVVNAPEKEEIEP